MLFHKGLDGRCWITTKVIPNVSYQESNDLAILLLHNPIRNYKQKSFSFIDVFEYGFVKNHNFRYESIIDFDTFKVYEISFEAYRMFSEPSKSEYWANEKIYIHSENYAILKLNYTIDCKLQTYSGKLLELNLENKKYKEKYYLNYISFCNYFRFKSISSTLPNKTKQYFQYRELFVNEIRTDSFKKMENEQIIRKDRPLQNNAVKTNKAFWKNYNYPGNLSSLYNESQQQSANLSKQLKNKRSNLPTDKIFSHTDRNLYQPGDTIYCQTYINDRFSQKFETPSSSSFVFLLNAEGEFIDSGRFRVDYAMTPGWLALPDDCLPGWYRIKTFTSQMQNYDPGYANTMWIRVEELIKENTVFNYRFNKKAYAPNDTVEVKLEFKTQSGELLKNTAFSYSTLVANKVESTYRAKTTRRGNSLLHVYLPDSLNSKSINLSISLEKGLGEFKINIPRHVEKPDIQFLPEGGTFVAGFDQKVGFNAVSHTGEQLFLKGAIYDDLGNFVDTIKSGSLGPGVIIISPEKGRKYHAEFFEYPNQKWALPDVDEDIPAIQVQQGSRELIVNVYGGNTDRQYYMALSKNYNLVAFTPITINKQKRIRFNTAILPPGMATITLFNSDLKPIAERILCIPRNNKPAFNISTEYDFYAPNQQTTLQIKIENKSGDKISGVFSIAVIDSSTALHPKLHLQYLDDSWLFDEEFYNNLPAHIKQNNLAKLKEDELDVLLLCYGWSKYSWNAAEKTKSNALVNYDKYNIEIDKVLSARKRKKIECTNDPLFILSLEEPGLIDLQKTHNNLFSFTLDSVSPFTQSIMLVPNFSIKQKLNAVTIKPVINTKYLNSFSKLNEQPVFKSVQKANVFADPVINLDSFRILKDIQVTAKREPAKKFVNQYEKRYQGVSTTTLSDLEVETAMTLEDMLLRLNPIKMQNKKLYISRVMNIGGAPPPALFVLDGMPVDTSYSSLMNISPAHIHSITALKGVSGFYIYGEDALGGVVFIETKLNHFGYEYELPQNAFTGGGDLRKVIRLVRANKEFYNPPQEKLLNDPEYLIRPTLFWNPEYYYDGVNPVQIQFYNHRKKGTVFVVVNGVTFDGEPVSEIYKYRIQ